MPNDKDVNTLYDNVSELNERHKLVAEERKLFCDILSSYVARDAHNSEDLRALLFDAAAKLADSSDVVELFCEAVSKSEFSLHSLLKDALAYDVFSPSSSAKIVYVKNNNSDSAFVRFSSIFKNPKVSYKSSFDEICEDVYNGVGDFCILPIENANGVKLFSFYSLIDKYELKIFAVCDLYEGNSEHSTRYALLSRKVLAASFTENQTPFYLEFSIISDNGDELCDILSASKKCGLKLFRIDTVSVPYDDSRFSYHHIFECSQKTALPFLLYLNFKYPQHKNIGYYISL
ncbi:MAG: hypothetical protein IKB02_07785 [Clostridia bacterium]|nr:hypothetical protein [Clostridia bacterium]